MASGVFSFFSKKLGKSTNISVILPEGIERPADGFKVIYLLHGWSEDHTAWMRQTSIERYAQKRNLAVIMPDGGFSFYNDMANGLAYLTYITEELPELCTKWFGISRRREDNFIGGLSMGGCGALTVGLTRPDLYSGLVVLSATNFPADAFQEQVKTITEETWPGWHKAMRRIYGDQFPDIVGTDYDAFHLAEKIMEAGGPFPRIFHYMGSDELDGMRWSKAMGDFFLGFEGNPFDYHFVTYPGIHTWDSWDAHICEALDWLGLTVQ